MNKGMTIKEINRFFLDLQRPSKDGITIMYARQGAAGIEKPFVIFTAPDDIETPEAVLARFRSVYDVMDYVQEYLKAKPNTGFWYA